MSNGVKIGLLVVIAGALGFLTYRIVKANDGDISSRPASSATTTQGVVDPSAQKAAAETPQKQGASSGEASKGRAKTTWNFDKTTHDFGKLKQGESAEYKFKFTNTGKEPLIIENAQGSCGCTVPNYPKDPIAPGASAYIDVKFNSAGKNGNQQKTVTLTANTDPSITTVLTIQADVEAPAGDAKAGQSGSLQKK